MTKDNSHLKPHRPFRLVSIAISLSLIFSLWAPLYLRASAQRKRPAQSPVREIAPTPGNALGAGLPDLSQIRYRGAAQPIAPAPVGTSLPCYDCGVKSADDSSFTAARLDPLNRTGQPDVDLLSGNFNWSKPLVDLKGRAGLDLKLSLNYNSLVWTRQGAQIAFDADRGQPSPGFRLGFPTIQPRYRDAQTGKYAYLLITPEGARVELRQAGGGNVYEATDNSSMQLSELGAGQAVLRRVDGTQLSFRLIGGQLQCTEVKDRNGNFISAAYNERGQLNTVTDTLGHTLVFNRDRGGNLLSISQPAEGAQERVLATFGYSELIVQTNFPKLKAVGPRNGAKVPVLTMAGLPDGSRYEFTYTTWGQVARITFHAPDGHTLAYTSYNLPQDATSPAADCPRATEVRAWAEGTNNEVETLTRYEFDPGRAWGQATFPDGTTRRETFATAGWQRGLTVQVEERADGALRTRIVTEWTQDYTGVDYKLNPRRLETNVYDSTGGRKRQRTEYGEYGLQSDAYEYGPDGATLKKRTHFGYERDAAYVSRHVLDLVKERSVYASDGTLLAKTTYVYDIPENIVDQGAVVQHDNEGYGAGLVKGRGLLTAVQGWNVKAPNDASKVVESRRGYNTNGSVIFTRSTSGAVTGFSYADNFEGGTGQNTQALITSKTSANGKRSQRRYDYSTGAVAWGQNEDGTITTATYDDAGRIISATNQMTGAFKRIIYAESGTLVATFVKGRANAKELGSYVIYDGARRMRAKAKDPLSRASGYKGMYIFRDAMGRVTGKTVPSKMSSTWVVADAAAAADPVKHVPLGFARIEPSALGAAFALFQGGDYYDWGTDEDNGYYVMGSDEFWYFVGDYDGAYNADLNATWNAAGGYWDFGGDQDPVVVTDDGGDPPSDFGSWWDDFWAAFGLGAAAGGAAAAGGETAITGTGSIIVLSSGGPGLDPNLNPGAAGLNQQGIDSIKQHLTRPELTDEHGTALDWAPNKAMVDRLQYSVTNGCDCIDGPDANFYLHETYENALMNQGWSYPDAHSRALSNYGVTEYDLYHPDVIRAYPGDFNDSWFDYYGIPRPPR
jgi:YD repeat-containing protein